jgi:hypothetical protein
MSFTGAKTLKGTWIYDGGVFNGKKESAPTDYQLQRKYSDKTFEAFLIEKGSKPQKYQAGNYRITADSCLETETFSSQPSNMTGKIIHYTYTIDHNTLIFKGKLPNGKPVEEHWKKLK